MYIHVSTYVYTRFNVSTYVSTYVYTPYIYTRFTTPVGGRSPLSCRVPLPGFNQWCGLSNTGSIDILSPGSLKVLWQLLFFLGTNFRAGHCDNRTAGRLGGVLCVPCLVLPGATGLSSAECVRALLSAAQE